MNTVVYKNQTNREETIVFRKTCAAALAAAIVGSVFSTAAFAARTELVPYTDFEDGTNGGWSRQSSTLAMNITITDEGGNKYALLEQTETAATKTHILSILLPAAIRTVLRM